MTSGRGAWALALATSVVATVSGTAKAQRPAFQAGVDLVAIHVSVTAGATAVSGLAVEDFHLADRGVPQKIDLVTVESLPIDVSLLLDTSNSVANRLDRLKTSVRTIVGELRPADRVRLWTFSGALKQVVPLQPPSQALLLDGLRAGGSTAIYDALAQTLMLQVQPGRQHLVVVFTDGVDGASVLAPDHVVDIAKRTDAVLEVSLVGRRDSEVLRRAAAATGGRLRRLESADDIGRTFRATFEQYRRAYVLYYTPHGVARDGWHDVVVSVDAPKGRQYTVHARLGYIGRTVRQ